VKEESGEETREKQKGKREKGNGAPETNMEGVIWTQKLSKM